ncbi:hypothetical protein M0Q97_09770 [Candidatus Dojkabacteria bacterium]|jgi:transcription elongation factor Elf1|nr:hypothetical protein [Candidatus Dojkabacteria bacterium]
MIKEKTLSIKITHRNKKFYKKYEIKDINKEYTINIDDVNKNSKVKITAICDICGKEHILSVQKYFKNINNYNLYTCKQCSYIKNKKSNIIKYGVEHPMQNDIIKEKTKNTCLKIYGVDNVFKSEIIKNKIKETNLIRYGFDHAMKNTQILNKSIITNILKYGVKRPAELDFIKEKIKNTKLLKYNNEYYNNIEKIKVTLKLKYNIDNPSKLKNHKEIIQNFHRIKILKKYKTIYQIDYDNNLYHCKCDKGHLYSIRIDLFHNRISHNINPCLVCYPENSLKSNKEKQLLDFIKENYDGKIYTSVRNILNGKELDIYLPDLKLAFEFNGIYWHSNKFKDDNYHLDKYNMCKERNINLIYIWEDEWNFNNKYIKNKILNNLKINEINETCKTIKFNILKKRRIKYNIDNNLNYICDIEKIKNQE